MTKNILTKFLTAMLLFTSMVLAQDEQDVDAIEKARQAKEAAEKAAAEASAATEAAIEAAAQKAAKEAREDAKRKKEEEEARKLAEAKAAEEAELDAAATAAAEAAKRKMAEELGLEYEVPSESDSAPSDTNATETEEEFVAKEKLGIDVGLVGSFGAVPGGYIVNNPMVGGLSITTPVNFSALGYSFNVSIFIGAQNGKVGFDQDMKPVIAGVGLNSTLFGKLFSETQLGLVAEGTGVRNFSGISLNLDNLPFKVLVGGEGFITLKADETDKKTFWGGLGLRLNYNL